MARTRRKSERKEDKNVLYEKGKAGELIPAGEVSEEALIAIEAADSEQIVERLTNAEYQPYFAYSFPVKTKEGTKDVIGISVDGAKEIAQEVGNIRVPPEWKVDEKDDYLYAGVPVTNIVRNVTLLGVGRQSKYILGEGWAPTSRLDELAFVKAINKAQRNGILAVVDQVMIANIVAKLDTRKIKKLAAPPDRGKLSPGTQPGSAETGSRRTEESGDKLKNLRQQIHIKAKAIAEDFYDKKVRPFIRDTFDGKSSTSDLGTEEELNKVLEFTDDNSPATDVDKRAFTKTLKDMKLTNDGIKAAVDKYREKTGKTTLCKGDLKQIVEEVKQKSEKSGQEVDEFIQGLNI